MACVIDRDVKNETDHLNGYECCRLCCDTKNLHNLFPANNSYEELLRKILVCTTVKIEPSECEDTWICTRCISKIGDFYQYREQCRTNDIKYQNWNNRLALCTEPAKTAFIPLDDNWAFRFVKTDDGATDNNVRESCASSVHATISLSDSETGSDEEVKQEPQDGTDGHGCIASDEEMYEPRASMIDTRVMSAEQQSVQTKEDGWNLHPDNRWLKSKSGRLYLFRQGFLYWQRTVDPTVIVANSEWYCINVDCDAKLHISSMNQLLLTGPKHEHASPLAKDSKTMIITNYLNMNEMESLNALERSNTIHNDERVDVSSDAKCPQFRTVCPAKVALSPSKTIEKDEEDEVKDIHNIALQANSHATDGSINDPSTAPSLLTDTGKRLVKIKIITWNNYRYRKQMELEGGGSMWVCTTPKICPAKVEVFTLADGRVKVRSIHAHNHAPTALSSSSSSSSPKC